MVAYLTRVWELRYFWSSLVLLDLRNRYRRSALGLGWAWLQPLAQAAVICAVFSGLWGLNVREFPSILAGFCIWGFISTTLVHGCHCFAGNENYIRQVPAPLAIYPLRIVLATGFHLVATMVLVLFTATLLREIPSPIAVLSVIPSLCLLAVLGWAIASLGGLVNTNFPDSAHIAEVLLQILFYATPVIYPPSILRDKGIGWMIDYNPLAAVMDVVRTPLIHGHYPPIHVVGVALLFVTLMALLASAALARYQKRLIYIL